MGRPGGFHLGRLLRRGYCDPRMRCRCGDVWKEAYLRPRGRSPASIPRDPTYRRRRWKREGNPETRSLGESGGETVGEKSVKSIIRQGLTPGGFATEQSIHQSMEVLQAGASILPARHVTRLSRSKYRPQHFRPFFLSFLPSPLFLRLSFSRGRLHSLSWVNLLELK